MLNLLNLIPLITKKFTIFMPFKVNKLRLNVLGEVVNLQTFKCYVLNNG